MPRPDLSTVPSFYHRYIDLVAEDELMPALKQHQVSLISLLGELAPEKWDYAYAPGKWTVKEVVQHIIDAERIFCYRALCFARRDATPLPGFDENTYAAASEASRRTPEELIEELVTVQKSSAQLFASFGKDQLEQRGVANNNPISVRAIGFIVAGHVLHHKKVLQERYGL